MKISYKPFIRTLEEQLYFDAMIEHLKKTNPKIPPSDVQDESTKLNLARDPSKDEEWQNRPLPTNWSAVPREDCIKEDGSFDFDKFVGARKLDPIEISHFEAIRRRPKNSFGQSELSSVSAKSRESGIQAFVYTPPAKVTKKEVESRAVNLVQYKSEPIIEQWEPMPWYKALLHKLKGNAIRQDVVDARRIWSDEILPDPKIQGPPKSVAKKP